MVHQFAEAYGWSLETIFKISMPQIILISHAGHVCYQRMKLKSESKDKSKSDIVYADQVTYRGKTLDKLNSDELAMYYGSMEGFGSVTVI